MRCRISQVDSKTLYVQWLTGTTVQYAGFFNNNSSANTFTTQISYTRNQAGTDFLKYDNFRVQRSAGFSEGYAQIANVDSNYESTNINRTYVTAWPFVLNSTNLQSWNYSASSDGGATFTPSLVNEAWNNLTSTAGKSLQVRVSIGNSSNQGLLTKGIAVAWANAST